MAGIVIVAHTPVASAMLGFAEHAFGVLPERGFIFGLLCTLRNQYMKDIIAEA
jgi:mannose/fructose-specific phosphotransferase system component IIA